jgi:hypothetical protein
MYLRTKTSKLSPRKTVQIVEAFINENGQRRQRIVQHLGVACDDTQLQELWDAGEKLIPVLEERAREEKLFLEGQLPLFSTAPEEYEREIPEGETVQVRKLTKKEDVLEGPFEVWGEVFDRLGLEDILGLSDRGRGTTHTLKLCLTAKLAEGGSKLRASEWLGEQLGLPISEDRIYRMMDKLFDRIDRVKELGFRCGRHLCGDNISLLLFDVTTLYFESFVDDEDEGDKAGLRRHGFSKDCKFKETQVVLALAASSDGIPLWYEVFPGNTAECNTVKKMVAEVKKRVNPEDIWVVADGAMLTKGNRDILGEAGAGYVLGSSVKKLSKKHLEQAMDLNSYLELDEGRRYCTISLDNGNTLIVTHSESKARKDRADRDAQVKRLLKKLNKKGEIAARTIIGNRGTSKYIEVASGGEYVRYRLNEEKIAEEARFDGLHSVETDREVKTLEDVRRVLGSYSTLWHIEDCFRVSKSDLKIRPVFHWTERRIRSHMAICFLALLMERYLEVQLRNKRNQSISPARIKKALLSVNSTLISDTSTGKLYRFPSRIPKEAREIYKALGLKRTQEPKEVTSLIGYRRRIPNIGDSSESEGQETKEI